MHKEKSTSKLWKRILSIVLALAMMVPNTGMTVFAAPGDEHIITRQYRELESGAIIRADDTVNIVEGEAYMEPEAAAPDIKAYRYDGYSVDGAAIVQGSAPSFTVLNDSVVTYYYESLRRTSVDNNDAGSVDLVVGDVDSTTTVEFAAHTRYLAGYTMVIPIPNGVAVTDLSEDMTVEDNYTYNIGGVSHTGKCIVQTKLTPGNENNDNAIEFGSLAKFRLEDGVAKGTTLDIQAIIFALDPNGDILTGLDTYFGTSEITKLVAKTTDEWSVSTSIAGGMSNWTPLSFGEAQNDATIKVTETVNINTSGNGLSYGRELVSAMSVNIKNTGFLAGKRPDVTVYDSNNAIVSIVGNADDFTFTIKPSGEGEVLNNKTYKVVYDYSRLAYTKMIGETWALPHVETNTTLRYKMSGVDGTDNAVADYHFGYEQQDWVREGLAIRSSIKVSGTDLLLDTAAQTAYNGAGLTYALYDGATEVISTGAIGTDGVSKFDDTEWGNLAAGTYQLKVKTPIGTDCKTLDPITVQIVAPTGSDPAPKIIINDVEVSGTYPIAQTALNVGRVVVYMKQQNKLEGTDETFRYEDGEPSVILTLKGIDNVERNATLVGPGGTDGTRIVYENVPAGNFTLTSSRPGFSTYTANGQCKIDSEARVDGVYERSTGAIKGNWNFIMPNGEPISGSDQYTLSFKFTTGPDVKYTISNIAGTSQGLTAKMPYAFEAGHYELKDVTAEVNGKTFDLITTGTLSATVTAGDFNVPIKVNAAEAPIVFGSREGQAMIKSFYWDGTAWKNLTVNNEGPKLQYIIKDNLGNTVASTADAPNPTAPGIMLTLPAGNYTYETQIGDASYGATASKNGGSFTVTKQKPVLNKDVVNVDADGVFTSNPENNVSEVVYKILPTINVTKLDAATDLGVGGSGFVLYKLAGADYELVSTNVATSFAHVSTGSYLIVETRVPTGYATPAYVAEFMNGPTPKATISASDVTASGIPNENKINIAITDYQKDVTKSIGTTIRNIPSTSLRVKAVKSESTTELVSGATFAVYEVDASGVVSDTALAGSWSGVDNDGYIKFNGSLPEGRYVVKEVAPQGRMWSGAVVEFAVSDIGALTCDGTWKQIQADKKLAPALPGDAYNGCSVNLAQPLLSVTFGNKLDTAITLRKTGDGLIDDLTVFILPNVRFQIFEDGSGTPLKFDEKSTGEYTLDPTGTDEITTRGNDVENGGILRVIGLDPDKTYIFQETFAPEYKVPGYDNTFLPYKMMRVKVKLESTSTGFKIADVDNVGKVGNANVDIEDGQFLRFNNSLDKNTIKVTKKFVTPVGGVFKSISDGEAPNPWGTDNKQAEVSMIGADTLFTVYEADTTGGAGNWVPKTVGGEKVLISTISISGQWNTGSSFYLPAGNYVIEETKAPAFYNQEDGHRIMYTDIDGNKEWTASDYVEIEVPVVPDTQEGDVQVDIANDARDLAGGFIPPIVFATLNAHKIGYGLDANLEAYLTYGAIDGVKFEVYPAINIGGEFIKLKTEPMKENINSSTSGWLETPITNGALSSGMLSVPYEPKLFVMSKLDPAPDEHTPPIGGIHGIVWSNSMTRDLVEANFDTHWDTIYRANAIEMGFPDDKDFLITYLSGLDADEEPTTINVGYDIVLEETATPAGGGYEENIGKLFGYRFPAIGEMYDADGDGPNPPKEVEENDYITIKDLASKSAEDLNEEEGMANYKGRGRLRLTTDIGVGGPKAVGTAIYDVYDAASGGTIVTTLTINGGQQPHEYTTTFLKPGKYYLQQREAEINAVHVNAFGTYDATLADANSQYGDVLNGHYFDNGVWGKYATSGNYNGYADSDPGDRIEVNVNAEAVTTLKIVNIPFGSLQVQNYLDTAQDIVDGLNNARITYTLTNTTTSEVIGYNDSSAKPDKGRYVNRLSDGDYTLAFSGVPAAYYENDMQYRTITFTVTDGKIVASSMMDSGDASAIPSPLAPAAIPLGTTNPTDSNPVIFNATENIFKVNHTSKGGIVLKKGYINELGDRKTIANTAEQTASNLSEITFSFQRQKDDSTWESYTYPGGDPKWTSANLGDNKIDLPAGKYRITETYTYIDTATGATTYLSAPYGVAGNEVEVTVNKSGYTRVQNTDTPDGTYYSVMDLGRVAVYVNHTKIASKDTPANQADVTVSIWKTSEGKATAKTFTYNVPNNEYEVDLPAGEYTYEITGSTRTDNTTLTGQQYTLTVKAATRPDIKEYSLDNAGNKNGGIALLVPKLTLDVKAQTKYNKDTDTVYALLKRFPLELLNATDDSKLDGQLTGLDGEYLFSGLILGDYKVLELVDKDLDGNLDDAFGFVRDHIGYTDKALTPVLTVTYNEADHRLEISGTQPTEHKPADGTWLTAPGSGNQKLSLINEYNGTQVKVKVVDEEDLSVIEGADLELYRAPKGTTDWETDPVAEVSTGTDGTAIFHEIFYSSNESLMIYDYKVVQKTTDSDHILLAALNPTEIKITATEVFNSGGEMLERQFKNARISDAATVVAEGVDNDEPGISLSESDLTSVYTVSMSPLDNKLPLEKFEVEIKDTDFIYVRDGVNDTTNTDYTIKNVTVKNTVTADSSEKIYAQLVGSSDTDWHDVTNGFTWDETATAGLDSIKIIYKGKDDGTGDIGIGLKPGDVLFTTEYAKDVPGATRSEVDSIVNRVTVTSQVLSQAEQLQTASATVTLISYKERPAITIAKEIIDVINSGGVSQGATGHVTAGGTVKYRLTVTNTSSDLTVIDPIVIDAMDESYMTIKSVDAMTINDATTTDYTQTGDSHVAWEFGEDLAPGKTIVVEYTAQVGPTLIGTSGVSNTGYFTSGKDLLISKDHPDGASFTSTFTSQTEKDAREITATNKADVYAMLEAATPKTGRGLYVSSATVDILVTLSGGIERAKGIRPEGGAWRYGSTPIAVYEGDKVEYRVAMVNGGTGIYSRTNASFSDSWEAGLWNNTGSLATESAALLDAWNLVEGSVKVYSVTGEIETPYPASDYTLYITLADGSEVPLSGTTASERKTAKGLRVEFSTLTIGSGAFVALGYEVELDTIDPSEAPDVYEAFAGDTKPHGSQATVYGLEVGTVYVSLRAPKITLGGVVWNGVDATDITETYDVSKAVAGATVSLYRVIPGGGSKHIADTTTDADGYYEFTGQESSYGYDTSNANDIPEAAPQYYVVVTNPAKQDYAFNEDKSVPNNDTDEVTIADAGVRAGNQPLNTQQLNARTGNLHSKADAVLNFADFRLDSLFDISGLVWDETTPDNLKAGETGIGGVEVSIEAGGETLDIETDVTGAYAFSGLRPGTYEVSIKKPNAVAGKTLVWILNGDSKITDPTTAAGAETATTAKIENITISNADRTNQDAGIIEMTNNITGTVWEDKDYNGIANETDTVAGVQLYLEKEVSAGNWEPARLTTSTDGGVVIGTVDLTGASPIEFITTLASGAYRFDNVEKNVQYRIVAKMVGMENTYSTRYYFTGSTGDSAVVQQSATEYDATLKTLTGMTDTFGVNTNAGTVKNIGLYKLSEIKGIMWQDDDGNGIQDATDNQKKSPSEATAATWRAGITVELLDDTGASLAIPVTTTTDANGAYTFSGVKADDYKVKFTAPAVATDRTYGWTIADAGSDDTKDSDVTAGITGSASTVAYASSVANVDAGVTMTPNSISGKLWEDEDYDGVWGTSPVETALTGVAATVELYKKGEGTATDTTTVKVADGSYQFDYVVFGSNEYVVRVVNADQDTYKFSEAQGTDEVKNITAATVTPTKGIYEAPDAYAETGNLSTTGSSITDVNAALYQVSGITGIVWEDDDKDDLLGSSDTKLEDVKVELSGGALSGTKEIKTAADGSYLFTHLQTSATPYKVTVTKPGSEAGSTYFWVTTGTTDDASKAAPTSGDAEVDATADIDLAVADVLYATVTEYQNAGLVLNTNTIDGIVWEDKDYNATKDEAATDVVSGVKVYLQTSAGVYVKVDSSTGAVDLTATAATDGSESFVTTAADGTYAFKGVEMNANYKLLVKKDNMNDTPSTRMYFTGNGGDSAVIQNTASEYDPTGKVLSGATSAFKIESAGGNTKNIGMYKLGEIKGLMWQDDNANGIQDAADNTMKSPGEATAATWRAGRTVELLDASGAPFAIPITTTTDADGKYSFGQLQTGSYAVRFEKASADDRKYAWTVKGAGDDQTGSDAEDSVPANDFADTDVKAVAYGTLLNNIDAGLVMTPNSISGQLWEDTNYDGVDDAGETALTATATVNLYKAADTNTAIQTTTTDAGAYKFEYVTFVDGITPQSYKIEVVNPDGDIYKFSSTTGADNDLKTITAGTVPATIGLYENPDEKAITDVIDASADTNITGINGAMYKVSSFEGVVWEDDTTTGTANIKDGSEPGLAGIKVTLTGGELPAAGITVTTGTGGTFKFTDIKAAADYVITVDKTALDASAPEGFTYRWVLADQGNEATDINSDVNYTDNKDATAATAAIVLGYDDHNTKKSAGIYGGINYITGTVWEDINRDSMQDESPLNGVDDVTVNLYEDGILKASVVNPADGIYKFNSIVFGREYQVEVVQEDGKYDFSTPVASSDNDIETITADRTTGQTATFTPSDNVEGTDAALYKVSTIKGLAWFDFNNNGIQDEDEEKLANMKVILSKTDDSSFNMEATTDETGLYEFTGLIEGTYKVTFDRTAIASEIEKYYWTTPNAQADEDSDAEFAAEADDTAATEDIVLGYGLTSESWDAGMYSIPNFIGGFAWKDVNVNGIFEVGEQRMPNVWVRLYKWFPGEAAPSVDSEIANASSMMTFGVTASGLVDRVQTDANGEYKFDYLDFTDGVKYQVVFENPDVENLSFSKVGANIEDLDNKMEKESTSNRADQNFFEEGRTGWFTPGFAAVADNDDNISGGLYEIPEYTVVYDFNDGSTPNSTPIKVKEGRKLPDAPAATRDGFTFEGWFYDGKLWDYENGRMPASNIVITAQWKEIPKEVDNKGNRGRVALVKARVAKTGDETTILLYGMALLLSSVAVVIVAKKRKRKETK